ncbi:MAG: hypothetical protein ACKV22_05185 [Bryobacteraceae bacterium]
MRYTLRQPLFVVLSLLAGACSASASTVYRPTPDYPPVCPDCNYRQSGPVFYPGGFALYNLDIGNFTNVNRTPSGGNEIATFQGQGSGRLQVLDSFFDITYVVDLTVLEINRIGNPTGVFQTELLQMDLIGGLPPFLLRERPTVPSLGQLGVTQAGTGTYAFDSFFDVFTELSLDGGQNWIPADQTMRLNLSTPEPTSLFLTLTGLLAVSFGVGFSRGKSSEKS